MTEQIEMIIDIEFEVTTRNNYNKKPNFHKNDIALLLLHLEIVDVMTQLLLLNIILVNHMTTMKETLDFFILLEDLLIDSHTKVTVVINTDLAPTQEALPFQNTPLHSDFLEDQEFQIF